MAAMRAAGWKPPLALPPSLRMPTTPLWEALRSWGGGGSGREGNDEKGGCQGEWGQGEEIVTHVILDCYLGPGVDGVVEKQLKDSLRTTVAPNRARLSSQEH